MKPLGSGPMPTSDPFLFCVYHKDRYPAGNEEMEAPRLGNGSDFDPAAPYRMYHGKRVPGFPQHPHRGFETITATIDGLIDHADSVGNAGRYGQGDLQWMTAGSGVVHSEMFPLLDQERDNPTRFFQIWLNLPAASKMVDPSFAMFWSQDVPVWRDEESGKARVTVWSGSLDYFWGDPGERKQNEPPPDSWAADPKHDVAIWHVCLDQGGRLTLPLAKQGAQVNRSLFYVEGKSGDMKVDGEVIKERVVLQVKADESVELEYSKEAEVATGEFLLLQGVPIQEPVKQYGPFVMNTAAEINQAFQDYEQTQFGGWPWPRDDMVFPRAKGRFAKLNGKETTPSDVTCSVVEK
jgi:redox-sensitive bicupin YhaK (pirin superfamily)